ncbi:nucleotidyltransferase family protein, partial [Bacteroides thetaiotaomicron]
MNILRNYKQKMSSYYGILRLGIFGSVARGEQTEDSDLDVFVELQIPN